MRKEISWILALGLTIYLSLIQLIMSSRFPLDSVVTTDKQKIHLQLPRRFIGDTDCPIILPIEDITVTGYVSYYLKKDSALISRIDFRREGDKLLGYLPKQAPNGEILYQIFLEKDKTAVSVNEGKPILLDYKGKVPLSLLVINALLIILVVLVSNLTGFFALFNVKSFRWMMYFTIFSLMFLGFFIHPLVQKYSINALWVNEWNFNSKILLVLITWSLALILSGRRNYRIWPVLATAISAAVFLIPHQTSMEEPVQITMKMLERNFIALLQLF